MLETSIKIVPLQEKGTGTLSDSDTTYVYIVSPQDYKNLSTDSGITVYA